MVQTKAGSKNNPWLEHLRQCAAEYQRRRGEHTSSEEQCATGMASDKQPTRRRAIGKKAIAPPKAEGRPAMKAQGKQKDAKRDSGACTDQEKWRQ